jgi:hypothetical protein
MSRLVGDKARFYWFVDARAGRKDIYRAFARREKGIPGPGRGQRIGGVWCPYSASAGTRYARIPSISTNTSNGNLMKNDHITSSIVDGRLNDLYWSSGYTVDEILAELGVGRNTLYASIEPLSTGVICTACGEILVFTNRMHRAAGTGACLPCGIERELGDGRAESWQTGRAGTDAEDEVQDGLWGRWREDIGSVAPERAALIGGAAALGVVVGAAAVRALRD